MRFDTDRLHCHFLKDDRIHPLKWPGESMVALSNGGPLVKVTALWIDLGLHGRSIIAGFTVVFAVGMCPRSMGFKRDAGS